MAERRITLYFSKAPKKLTRREKDGMETELVELARQEGFYGVMDVRYKEETMNAGAGAETFTEVSGIPSHCCSEI